MKGKVREFWRKFTIGVMVRTQFELAAVFARNPFPEAESNRVIVFFLDEPVPQSDLDKLIKPGGERLLASGDEVFVHYPDGQGASKLRLPFAKVGTGRNLNTISKLIEMGKAITR